MDFLLESSCPPTCVYSSVAQSPVFNENGTFYSNHWPSTILSAPPPTSPSSQQHFHSYCPTRTFENSNRHQFRHSFHLQSLPVFQPSSHPQLSTPSSSTFNVHQEQEDLSIDLPPRFRHLKKSNPENKYSQGRPMSGDFERFHSSSSRFFNNNYLRTHPQSFHDVSSRQHNFFRSSNSNHNGNRYPRDKNNSSLPLAAYMDTNDSSYENENNFNNNYWQTSYSRRRSTKQRSYYPDKHYFPLSSYDPRRYGFNKNYQKRNDSHNQSNSNRNDQISDIDLIEEWWEDDGTELIGTDQSVVTTNSQPTTTTVEDSGNSSLSTSINLKESTLDDEKNNISTNNFINPPSDISITDSKIIF